MDKRTKTETAQFTYGLHEVMQIGPIWFRYNGLAGTISFSANYVKNQMEFN